MSLFNTGEILIYSVYDLDPILLKIFGRDYFKHICSKEQHKYVELATNEYIINMFRKTFKFVEQLNSKNTILTIYVYNNKYIRNKSTTKYSSRISMTINIQQNLKILINHLNNLDVKIARNIFATDNIVFYDEIIILNFERNTTYEVLL